MLSDIDTDKLFETSTVEGVEEVQKKINHEIELKKEELRTLVGERYRDLIEAADTIKDMKGLSLKIIEDVETMNLEMKALKNKLGFKPIQHSKEKSNDLLDSIAAQISIFIELPELIWMAISIKDYIKATQFYLLGRHIKTGFTADKNLKKFAHKLPVIEQQWITLSRFSSIILKEAESDLKKIDLSNEEASMCLSSIAILQDTSLVSKFLTLRTEALESHLQCDKKVTELILESVHCIVNSLSLLNSLILEPWESGKGLVWKKLNDALSNNQNPINLLQENIKLSFLPPVILHFKVKPLSKNNLNIEELENTVMEWLNNVKQIISTKGKNLLNRINNLRNLSEITAEHSVFSSQWEQLLTLFNVKDKFDLWNGIYKVLITSRAKELISIQCDETYKNVIKNIQSAISEEDIKRSDLDMRWFIWKESSDDLDLPNNLSPTIKGIILKSKAITPKVYNVCSAFEKQLQNIFQDLSGLYSNNGVLDYDSNELKNHQQQACSLMIQKLIKKVHDLVNSDINEGKVTILARFLQAVPETCPTLHDCLMLGENKDVAWDMVKILNSESMFCWGVWEKKSLQRMSKYVPEAMKTPTTYEDVLNMIPQWDLAYIEENDKNTKIRVPSSPSLALQTTLQQVMTDIGKAHVPKLIAENVLHKVVPILLECYNTEKELCQAYTLQCLFDVKFIAAQFIPLTNKELNKLGQEKISKLEALIDPIDLEVFSPLIRTNIKIALIKTQTLFGLSFHSEDNTRIKMSDDACILAISKSLTNIWFPLLPVTNPTNRLVQTKQAKVKEMIKPDKLNETESSKNQSSSSFFYEWFS